jgi:peptidoglycan/xylan/chitin deacetylase (PgdA/CDA1 family)
MIARLRAKWRRLLAVRLARRCVKLNHGVPVVSFSFDDFPKSALETGGAILERHGVRGTYYASFGLMGENAPVGELFAVADVADVLARGHELGCHTFHHRSSWDVKEAIFEASVLKNGRALYEVCPHAALETLSYPYGNPSPAAKRVGAKYFTCARGGGQTLNSGWADLNNLRAFFIEQSRDHLPNMIDLIRRNRDIAGWLIFATHDVCSQPSPFGCTSQLLGEVVQAAVESKARVLPIGAAWRFVRAHLEGV